MERITRTHLRELTEPQHGPCVSLYLPAPKSGATDSATRWKNLLKTASTGLQELGWKTTAIHRFLRPAGDLTEDPTFWRSLPGSLLWLAGPDSAALFSCRGQVPELAVVAPRFHVKPLFPLLVEARNYLLLTISQNRVRLFRGDEHQLVEVDVKGVPTSLAQALQFHDRDEPLMYHSQRVGGTWSAIFHGQGVGIDDHKSDLLTYFRAIDKGLHDYLRGEHIPLVVAGVEYLQPIFREACSYPDLLDKGVAGNVDHLPAHELHDRSWEAAKPAFRDRDAVAIRVYEGLEGTGRTCREPGEVLARVAEGKLEHLFVAGDKYLWGTMAAEWAVHETKCPGDEDVLNWAAGQTYRHGGAVHVLPANRVPGKNLLAGIYWLPLAKQH